MATATFSTTPNPSNSDICEPACRIYWQFWQRLIDSIVGEKAENG